jgi:hypothetical protein
MKIRLGQIASINTGLFARPQPIGDIVYVQLKHFNGFGALQEQLHADLKADAVLERHLLEPGNVLYSAKGSRNFAAVFDRQEKQCVASTTFFIIRLHERNILPEYLAWYLNHPHKVQFLKSKAKGTSIISIQKKTLEEMEIDIPFIDTQQSILKIYNLHKKQKKIRERLESLHDLKIQRQLLSIAQGK